MKSHRPGLRPPSRIEDDPGAVSALGAQAVAASAATRGTGVGFRNPCARLNPPPPGRMAFSSFGIDITDKRSFGSIDRAPAIDPVPCWLPGRGIAIVAARQYN